MYMLVCSCTRTFMCVDINHVSQHNSVNTICIFVIVEESPIRVHIISEVS